LNNGTEVFLKEANEFEKLLHYLQKQSGNTSNSEISIEEIKPLKNYTISTPDAFTDSLQSSKGFDVSLLRKNAKEKLIEEFKSSQQYERPYISITELVSCPRQVYYSRKKYQVDFDKMFNFVYLKLAANIGNSFHNFIQDTYGFKEKEKTVISEQYKVKGRLDATQANFVYEIKPVDEDKMKDPYNKAHYDQAVIGAWILNNEYNYYIDTITLIYYVRNNFRKNPIALDFPYVPSRAIELLSIASYLHRCLQDNTVPTIKTKDGNLCKYCPYTGYCTNDKLESVHKESSLIYNSKEPEKKKKEAVILF